MQSQGECWNYLAAERAEAEGVEEAAIAYLAGVGDAFSGAGLRALVQEHNLSAVDYVCLNTAYVQVLLNFIHSDHIVVRRPPYLPPIHHPIQMREKSEIIEQCKMKSQRCSKRKKPKC